MFKNKIISITIIVTIFASLLSFGATLYAADSASDSLRDIVSTHGRIGFNPSFKASTACEAGWAALPGETGERIRLCRNVYRDENNNQVSGRDVFFQFSTNSPSDMESYVYEIDVYPLQLPGVQGYKCSLLNAIDSVGAVTPLMIVGSDLVYNDEKLMTVECGKWTKFSAIVDNQNLTFDIYADRILVKENLPLSKKITPSTVRVAINAGYMYTEMYFDNIKLYEGDSFRDIPLYLSVAENEDDVSEILGDSMVFMTEKDCVYINGSKTTYSSLGYEKLFEDDTLYVTKEAAMAAFDCADADLTEYIETKNGTDYVSLTPDIAEAFSKHFYFDDRGWICISSSALNLANYSVSTVSTEKSDIIDRFMHFDRPDTDEIYSLLKTNSYKQHPRIWQTSRDVARLRSDIESNAFKKSAAEATIYMADQLLSKDPVEYSIPDGVRLFQSCLEVRNRIMTLSAAYLISDESVRDKYAAKIWEEVENACNWKDWNLTSHYLDSGKIGPGIAIAYDVCYDYFTDEQKAFIRQSLKEKYLYYAAASYAGTTAHYSIGKNNSNWGAVCNGSVLMVCLATMDEEDESSEYTALTKYLAREALQGMEYSVGSVYPNGAWAEGLGYFEYMVEYISWSANALRNSCGSDFGLTSYPGIEEMPLYALYIQTVNNGYFNYGDGAGIDETSSVCPEIFLLASLLGRDDIANMWYDFKYKKLDTSIYSNRGVRDMLFYTPDSYESDTVYDFPLDAEFGSVEIGVMKSGWDSDDTYVAAVGGAITSHWDKGGFVFDALGERWAIDLGKDDYNIEGGYYGMDGATIYRKRAEGHNTLVINPDEDAGQIFGASANIKSTCFGELDAYMIYDLSNVYADDVTKAERGFYFGDARRTLTIQDEFTLKESDSEVMWFMHTKADIAVSEDGKSAMLTKNGKSVKVEFVTNLTDWSVEAVAAEPLPTTPERDGQTANTGVTKVRFTGTGNGDCYITAKLSPVTANSDYESIHYIPMSAWNVRVYDEQCTFDINNSQSLAVGEGVNAVLFAPTGFISSKLSIGDVLVGEFTDSGSSTHTFTGYIPPSVASGFHTATVSLRYPGYPEEIVLTEDVNVFGSVASSNVIDFEELEEATYTSASDAKSAVGWFKEITSNINGKASISINSDDDKSHGKVYTVKLLDGVSDILAGQSYAHIYARQKADKSFVTTTRTGKVIFEFDIKLRGFWGASATFTPYSGGGSAHTGYTLVASNKIAGTEVSLASGYNWYHVQLIIDLDNMIMYGKFGDVMMPAKNFAWNSSNSSQNYLTYFRLGARAYSTVNGEPDYFSIDNITTSYVDTPKFGYSATYISEPEISVSDGYVTASFDADTRESMPVAAIIAIYNGNKLETVKTEEIDLQAGFGNYITSDLLLPEKYTDVRCFVWQSVRSLVPANKTN